MTAPPETLLEELRPAFAVAYRILGSPSRLRSSAESAITDEGHASTEDGAVSRSLPTAPASLGSPASPQDDDKSKLPQNTTEVEDQ